MSRALSAFLALLVLAFPALSGCTAPEPEESTPTGQVPTTSGPTPGTTPATPTTGTPGAGDCAEPAEHGGATSASGSSTDANGSAPGSGEVMGYPELVFTVAEPRDASGCFGFVGPASVRSGWTAITLRNDGAMPHIMPMVRLAGNRTWEDYKASAEAATPPAWVVPVGGPGFATPGQNGTVILDLEPGTYVLACHLDGHDRKGMVRPLEVVAEERPPAQEPDAEVVFILEDYNFTLPRDFGEGRQVVRFVNRGTEPHEAPVVRLEGNATAEEMLAAILEARELPGEGIGGVNVFAPGRDAYAVLDLTPGRYALLCFVESPAHDGAPHVMLGMVTEFEVE